jgi:serine/threonine protein phosphatase PrpC
MQTSNQQQQSPCFKEYSYKEEKNAKFRHAMEDYSKIVERYMEDPNKALFTLYDGHGGADPVIYVKDRMPVLLQKFLQNKELTVESAMTQAFNKIDEELKYCDSENAGCTACIAYICNENDKRWLYCANVGDTRCIIICEEANLLTQDHKCSDSTEVERVKENGGVILHGRVYGQLVLTRALGDHALKSYGVISTPFISKIEIEDKHKYVIIASDGVWDAIQLDELMEISKSVDSAEGFVNMLVKNAMDGGSKDNISCIAIKLN